MTKLKIDPGVCGMIAYVTAHCEDEDELEVSVESPCGGVRGMMDELGGSFDPYELCFARPGSSCMYEYAAEHFPCHGGCPVIAGIVKCVEAECNLALKKNVSFVFEE